MRFPFYPFVSLTLHTRKELSYDVMAFISMPALHTEYAASRNNGRQPFFKRTRKEASRSQLPVCLVSCMPSIVLSRCRTLYLYISHRACLASLPCIVTLFRSFPALHSFLFPLEPRPNHFTQLTLVPSVAPPLPARDATTLRNTT